MGVRRVGGNSGKGKMRSVKSHSRKGGGVKSYLKRLKSGARLRIRNYSRATTGVKKTSRRRKGSGVRTVNHNFRSGYLKRG